MRISRVRRRRRICRWRRRRDQAGFGGAARFAGECPPLPSVAAGAMRCPLCGFELALTCDMICRRRHIVFSCKKKKNGRGLAGSPAAARAGGRRGTQRSAVARPRNWRCSPGSPRPRDACSLGRHQSGHGGIGMATRVAMSGRPLACGAPPWH